MKLNIESALEMVGGDRELLDMLIQKFYDKYSNVASDIIKKINSGDKDSAIITVHSLKGLLGNVGADVAADRARDLEAKLKSSNFSVELKAFELSMNAASLAMKEHLESS